MGFRAIRSASSFAASLACGNLACTDGWLRDEADLARCVPGIGVAPPELPPDAGEGRVVFDATDVPGERFRFEVAGSGGRFVGHIALHGGVGTVDFGCEQVSAAVFAYHGSPYWMLRAFGVSRDRWYTIELYCSEENSLEWITYASTDGTRHSTERASGVCIFDTERVLGVDLRFPAVDMPLPRPLPGFTIDGPAIKLASDGRGSILLDGTQQEMIAFDAFACSTEEECSAPPFYEIATLIRNPSGTSATLGVLQFDLPGNPVNLAWQVEMPGFAANLTSVPFEASFTTP